MSTTTERASAETAGSYWLPVICGALILTIGLGARQSFGIFQRPVAADLGVGRELWSFANASAMLLVGAVSPFVGAWADRLGAARVVALGGVLYVGGMLMMAAASDGVLIVAGSLISGVGMAAAGFGPILGAIGRRIPTEKRSLALGFVTAGGSFGQFAIVPLAAALQARFDNWHTTMVILAVLSLAMIPLAAGLRVGKPLPGAASAAAAPRQSVAEALREAFAVPGFWLLTAGFFVCGFHVSFIGLHLPPYIADHAVGLSLLGVELTPLELGGWAIGLVGLANIAGAIGWGWLGGKFPRKDMLTLLYALRALGFLVFLLMPLSAASVLVFSATLGFLWLGTIPLTSGLVGFMFGPAYMGMLYGIVFFSHQLGSFFGGWGAGRLYDVQGNYDAMWWISIGLGLFAALMHWLIRERPVARLAAAPA